MVQKGLCPHGLHTFQAQQSLSLTRTVLHLAWRGLVRSGQETGVNYPKWGKNENPEGNEDCRGRHFTPRHFISDDAVCRWAFRHGKSEPWRGTVQGTHLSSLPPWGRGWHTRPAGLFDRWSPGRRSFLPAPTCPVRWRGGPLPTLPHLSSWPMDLQRPPPLAKDALSQRCGSSRLAARMVATGPGQAQRWGRGWPRMARAKGG